MTASIAHPVAVVAGHICLDIIPAITAPPLAGGQLVMPGKLSHVGPATIATGGAVANTGLALHKLGIETRLIGKIGDDLFGRAIVNILSQHDPSLASDLIKDPQSPSSYTLVLSAPGLDRGFLHCSGANDTFCAADIDLAQLTTATHFHFGYPPILRGFYADGGKGLADLLQKLKSKGLTTSLDTAHVDVDAPAGTVNWRQYLACVLPHVDFFLPSVDELLFMLDRRRAQQFAADAGEEHLAVYGGITLLQELASALLKMGVGVVALKLGEEGIYLRTTGNPAWLQHTGKPSLSAAWLNRELLAPAFQVRPVGTTGAGDCAVAGFLAAALRGFDPEDALTIATAVGACNVEAADATSGIPSWQALHARLQKGWPRRATGISLIGWHRDEATGLYHGPNDHSI